MKGRGVEGSGKTLVPGLIERARPHGGFRRIFGIAGIINPIRLCREPSRLPLQRPHRGEERRDPLESILKVRSMVKLWRASRR